jgi:hypothetical protein
MIDTMQGHTVLILLIAACTQTRAKAPAPTPATGRCVPIAQANAEAGRARQRNDQRFNDQLTQRGLNLVALETAGVESGEQTAVATAEMRTIGGVAKRVLVTPSWTCATETLQLAKNAQRELYVIQSPETRDGSADQRMRLRARSSRVMRRCRRWADRSHHPTARSRSSPRPHPAIAASLRASRRSAR